MGLDLHKNEQFCQKMALCIYKTYQPGQPTQTEHANLCLNLLV